jgi:hypothetical protein
MIKRDKFRITYELDLIEKEQKILDPNNPIEAARLDQLRHRLNAISLELQIIKKKERLSKFQIVENYNEDF